MLLSGIWVAYSDPQQTDRLSCWPDAYPLHPGIWCNARLVQHTCACEASLKQTSLPVPGSLPNPLHQELLWAARIAQAGTQHRRYYCLQCCIVTVLDNA
jgi:hypothetical protein